MTIVNEQARPVRLPSFPEFVALTASLMAMTALSIDIMLPALPLIRESLGVTDVNQQQLVITLYMVGFGIGQLFYGPLSDRFGRKPILIAGLALYAVASAICAFADDFGVLLAARGLQGVANAAPRVIAVAVVRDLYGGRRMAEVMSFVMMVFIIVPAIAPALGSGILMLGPWHLIFVLLGVVSVMILIWIMLRLPETRAPDAREPLTLGWLGTALRQVLTTRQTIGYTAAVGFFFGGMMACINSAEQVFVETYHAGALFPVLFGAVALALAAAALLNSRLVMQLGMRRIGHVAACGYAAIAVLHLILELTAAPLSLTLFLCLMSVQIFCFGFVMPNFNALAMEPMGRIAGTASSFIGALTTCIAAFLGWIIGQSYDGTALPLTFGFVVFGLCGIIVTLITERGRLFRAGGPVH